MTSSPSQTPGPWHVGTKEAHHCVYDAHGWCIADASPQGKDAETLPNARLIASAPELLAALQAIVAILDGRQPIDVPGALMVAEYAIAKAKGGQS
jgi:hypothetical protein